MSYYNKDKKCLKSIKNCITYDATKLDNESNLICTACDTKFYLSTDYINNSTICIKNKIP